jgi:hypothetical protein
VKIVFNLFRSSLTTPLGDGVAGIQAVVLPISSGLTSSHVLIIFIIIIRVVTALFSSLAGRVLGHLLEQVI